MKAARHSTRKKRAIPLSAEAAMHRAARRAREIARRYGTPIYVMRDGKIVALKP